MNQKKQVFCDYHHIDLLYSLQILFEKRLGWELYIPLGLEWYKEGYWNVYPHPSTAEQYLSLQNSVSEKDGIHQCNDEVHHTTQQAIRLDQFKQMKFDIVLASMPQHIEPFKNLIKLYQPQAKFVFQQGNMFTEVINHVHEIPNLLSSTIAFPVPTTTNAIFYHQEFDTNIFRPSSLPPEKLLTSFVNCLPQTEKGYQYYLLKEAIPEYELRSYGGSCDDGIISGVDNISTIMQRSFFGIHIKKGADGYGHILHNWFACGKPVVINYNEYKDKLGGKLLVPNETCLTVDGDSDIPRVAETIKNLSPEKYQWMSQQAYKKFKEIVNFNQEEKEIKVWLEHLN